MIRTSWKELAPTREASGICAPARLSSSAATEEASGRPPQIPPASPVDVVPCGSRCLRIAPGKKEWDDAVGFTIPPHGSVGSDLFHASDYMQFASLNSLRHRLCITVFSSIDLDNSGGTNPQVKTSPQMEKVGFVQCLGELHSKDLKVSTVTTDRHPGIRNHIRKKEPGLKHELDSWHVVKEPCLKSYITMQVRHVNKLVELTELMKATLEECSSGSFPSMRESRTTPGPPPMLEAYARLPKLTLVAKRMLRFKT
ncbi:hypothetical protein HPB49_019964 [Dermacentor silvarum]|uniref:Uncharacterized protein n=1 Tax=Dermacentor silvarum TaxID=543639 RepID=A0ACB8CH45_DERSI|nr:hypothetical protein HPB49_019964 [Dermacentor silvarum]